MSLVVLLGGLLIVVQGIMNIAGFVPLPPPEPIAGLVRSVGGYTVVGVITLVAGLLVLFGGWMIQQKKKRNGALLAIVFAIVSMAGGGGFIIGAILGFFGGLINFRVVE